MTLFKPTPHRPCDIFTRMYYTHPPTPSSLRRADSDITSSLHGLPTGTSMHYTYRPTYVPSILPASYWLTGWLTGAFAPPPPTGTTT